MCEIYRGLMSLWENRKAIVISFLAILIVASSGYSFEMPLTSNYTEESYHCLEKNSGTERWHVDWTIEKVEKDDRIILVMGETGRQVYGSYEERVSWFVETFLEYTDSLQSIYSTKEIRNREGETIEIISKKFDVEHGFVEFERRNLISGKVSNESFEPGSTIIGTENIGIVLRGMNLAEGVESEFYLCTDEPKLYKVTAKCLGKEKIIVNGREFETYKVELIFHVGFWKLFVPRTYFWYTVNKPHKWIRYEGLESGHGTPQVVMEVLDFQ